MIESLIQNIENNFSLSEIDQLERLLASIKMQKVEELSKSPTIEIFYSEYKEYIKNTLSESYLKSVELSFKILIEDFGRDKKLSEISIRDAEYFKINRLKSAPKGYAVYLRTIRAAFNIAVQWELITSNPFTKIKFRKTQKIKPPYLTETQFNKILPLTVNRDLKNLFTVCFYTGIRLSEAVNLRWRNISLDKKLVTIGDNEFTTKNAKQRIIPLCNQVMNVLEQNKIGKPDNFVFSKSNGFPFRKEYVSKKFKEVSRKAGLVEDIHFHSLRHSFASNLAQKGVPIVAIRDLLGHSSIATTQIYSHSNVESLVGAIAKFDE
jgi:site-specific recombinase XerD